MSNIVAKFICFWDVVTGKAKKHVVYTYVKDDELTSVSIFDDNTPTEHLVALLKHAVTLIEDRGYEA